MLHKKIFKFLETYAEIKPDYEQEFDDPEDKYASPDAGILHAAATLIAGGKSASLTSDFLFFSWSSGGFSPYSSKEGQKELEEIKDKLRELIK